MLRLFDRARLRAGERVLIHGASGSVGIFAVQLARRAGASVIATASARNTEFLRMVTIAADSEGTQDERTKAAFFIVEPNQQELSEIARLVDGGDLKVWVDGVVPLTQASAAYFGAAGRQLRRGKVVITLIDEPRG